MDRAERRGLAQRSAVPGDRRALQATLTDAGRRAAAAFHTEVGAELSRLVAPLAPHDREHFRSALPRSRHIAGRAPRIVADRSPTCPGTPAWRTCCGRIPAVAEFDELNIPKAVRPVAEEVIKITDEVCAKLLDAEYAALARQVVAKLARKRPSPLLSGRRATWAAGVVYALGQVNFLSDPSREPYLTADELSDAFGVAKTTMGSKAKQVRDILKMDYIAPEFMRADVADDNPAVWFVEVDGLIMDARSLSLDLQTTAFARGYIPYVPALGRDGTDALMDKARQEGLFS
jgi:hypothetical protein